MLSEVLDADYLVPKIGVTFVEPVNLKPTNYCTAMWNGLRCDGTHDQATWVGENIVHSVCNENGRLRAAWSYGGIRMDDLGYIESPDFDLGWSDLNRIHAIIRETDDWLGYLQAWA